MIVIAIEIAYMASSRVIYHYPDLSFAEVEAWRTLPRLIAAGAEWLLMQDVLSSRERNPRALRRPLFWVAIVIVCAAPAILGMRDVSFSDSIVICLAAIPVGLHEEIFFRGIAQTLIVRRWGLTRGLAATVVLFALFHLGVMPDRVSNFIDVAIYGVILGLIYARTGSLFAVVVLHAVVDALWSIPAIIFFVPLSWYWPVLGLGACLIAVWARQPPSAT